MYRQLYCHFLTKYYLWNHIRW